MGTIVLGLGLTDSQGHELESNAKAHFVANVVSLAKAHDLDTISECYGFGFDERGNQEPCATLVFSGRIASHDVESWRSGLAHIARTFRQRCIAVTSADRTALVWDEGHVTVV